MDPVQASVAYLGPAGTFTESATHALRSVTVTDRVPMSDAAAIAAAVESGQFDCGVVPIENSVHGTVLPTLDELVFVRESLLVREEVVVDVAFALYGHPSATDAPTAVLSHPHALAQCTAVIAERGLQPTETSSTAEACRVVSDTRHDAVCIAARGAGEQYGLRRLADNVQDRDGGRTRFWVLARRLAVHDDSDAFRTALVLTPGRDRPGILLEMLRPFAERGLNLSSLMSRPLRSGLGLYCFIVVVDAHIDAPRFGAAISELLDQGVRVKNLGSYLAWAGPAPSAGAQAEFPPGSVGAGDAPARQAAVLAPPHDGPGSGA